MEIVISLVIIILDRISKILAKNYLLPVHSIPLIKGVFNLTYTQNTGAAFSIFSKHTSLLSIFTFIVVVIGIIFYLKVKKLNPTKKWFLMSIVWILAGAVGNLIDRVLYSYVIDYFDFCLINFAIFNVADCFITVGGIILGACLIFDKDITI